MENLLYIGLNGFAGSGKDTVAKMLYVILNFGCTAKDTAYALYKSMYATNVRPYATLNDRSDKDLHCTCIAFADQLKKICADMFGVPVQYFYYNKGTAWICINKDFEYTETKPVDEYIVTAEDYYTCKDNYMHSSNKYWMSLREILVYVGTYVCQYNITKNVFVNSVKNNINYKMKSGDLKYVICTDVRFMHEYDFIRANHGLMINIVRESVRQADDIAEHELDALCSDDFDCTIFNDGTYDDLFDAVWGMVKNDVEFWNETVQLQTRDRNCGTYLRKINPISSVDDLDDISECNAYKLCYAHGLSRITHSDGRIVSIDPVGGPEISVGMPILGTSIDEVRDIIFDDVKSSYVIIA